MAQILTLISGKGGSGKTTLSLSLSKLLLECDLRILLVDCDLATNGATYFFETKYNFPILTTNDILANKIQNPILEVQKGFFFIPTNTHFPYEITTNVNIDYKNFTSYLLSISQNYDIIIFDCQAGYTKILEKILSFSNVNLIVMEPDAISASSVRVLYAQVANLLESSKTYQIFNKITKEENKIYNDIFPGTLFTSLPSIIFNWDVRKAFAYSQVPEMVTTNVDFGKSVYSVAQILFPKYNKKLKIYEQIVLMFEQEQIERQIQDYRDSIKVFKEEIKVKKARQIMEPIITIAVPIYVSLLFCIFNVDYDKSFLNSEIFTVLLLLILFSSSLVALLYIKYKRKRKDEFYKIETAERELLRLEKTLEEVKKSLEC